MKPNPLSRFLLVFVFAATMAGGASAQTKDPMPSWSNGVNKSAIVAFVTAVTKEGGDAFVPVADRIATFDLDGTLLVEQPLPVVMEFANKYVEEVAQANPNLQTQPYRAMREGDQTYLNANYMQVLTSAGIGLNEDDYRQRVKAFSETARHPRFNTPYVNLFYAPMRELVAYLRANDFKVYILSGSSQGFVRGIAKGPIGLPNAQMIGTQLVLEYQGDGFTRSGAFRDLATVGAGKPLIIEYQIGQKPIFSFGNSSGDQAMFEYTTSNKLHKNLSLWLEHDDAAREYAYDSGVKALPGLLKVSMKNDFAKLFDDE